jgi:putative endopeptidase
MSHQWVYAVCMVAVTASCANHPEPPQAFKSGIDLQYVDRDVRPQDDLYQYLNGQWLRTFEIPADKSTYGSFNAIDDALQLQLRGIVEAPPAPDADVEKRKIADLYASFMDETRLETVGAAPLRAEFAAIDAVKDADHIPELMGHLASLGVALPFNLGISVDSRDSTQYAVYLSQGGLGLPDRDYYLKDDAKLKDARVKYLAHVEKMLAMAGEPQAGAAASAIVSLETSLAGAQWTRVENRDPIKTYNRTVFGQMAPLMPHYDWTAYFRAMGVTGRTDAVIVRQPTYLGALGTILGATPLPVWKLYFKWRLLSEMAPYLSKAFVEERFAFSGTVLRGTPENRPRWKRGIGLIDDALGEALGRLYVAQYFPPESRARMQALVANLMDAYRRDLETLDWMSEATKAGAREKLQKLDAKIGYPDKWRDYSGLRIERDDLFGNVLRSNAFDYQFELAKLGMPVDRGEWHMTPQTVNAYYNPTRNEIVFPAAILQPPFFDAKADDAVNYGGIGAVIGHEMSHGFDDQGSQYDADGNLRDWFTPADHEKFAVKTKALVAQYAAYEPVPGYHVNGELTLGENIADNSGLAIAYKAYQLSLHGHPAPVIDGFSGAQRFYLGWAQVWRGKTREAEAVQRVKTDPHSPPQVRGYAPLRNQDGFYSAFALHPADKMYLAPAERVDIW